MSARKNVKKVKYIFIDTNLYYGLFVSHELCKEVLPILEKLSKNENYKILFPQQILDEINRNRFTSWLRPLGSKALVAVRDSIVGAIANLRGAKGFLSSIENELKKRQKESAKRLKRLTSSTGDSSKLLNRLTELCVVIPDSEEAFAATKMRVAKGNPPDEKNNVKKDCDRYIWELILHYFVSNNIDKPHLYIFTKNTGDWCVDIEEKKIFHPFLSAEFSKKCGGKIEWFDNLKNLPDTTASEKQAVQKEVAELRERDVLRELEEQIADKLRLSNTWANSDKIMRGADPYISQFSAKTIIDIIQAAKENAGISAGPYNQVLDASGASAFLTKVFDRSLEVGVPMSTWKQFYADMGEDEQKRFVHLRKKLEHKGVEFNFEELKHFLPEDIPF